MAETHEGRAYKSRQKVIAGLLTVQVLTQYQVECASREALTMDKDLFTVRRMEAEEAFYLLKAAYEERLMESWRFRSHGAKDFANPKTKRYASAEKRCAEMLAYARTTHVLAIKVPANSMAELKEKRVVLKRLGQHPIRLSSDKVKALGELIEAESARYIRKPAGRRPKSV